MSRLYFIFVPILLLTFQYINGKGRSSGDVSDIADDQEENHELLADSPLLIDANVFFGPLLIIISLLVLRVLSKRAEE